MELTEHDKALAHPPTLDTLTRRVSELPPLPEVAQAILRFGDGSEAGLRGLCARIQQDPALTARVLRVANSPFYGLQGSVHTLDDAMVVLGSATLRAIALTGALIGPFDTARSEYFDVHRFWRHALASAVLAQRLGQSIATTPAVGFTAGLLHQVGVLALCTVDARCFDRIAQRAESAQTSFATACRSECDWEPNQLGAALARRWALPDTLCAAMLDWRCPPAGRQLKSDRQLADVLHVADRLAHLLVALPAEPWPRDLAERLHEQQSRHRLEVSAVERIGLDTTRLLTLLRPVARELERLETLLH